MKRAKRKPAPSSDTLRAAAQRGFNDGMEACAGDFARGEREGLQTGLIVGAALGLVVGIVLGSYLAPPA